MVLDFFDQTNSSIEIIEFNITAKRIENFFFCLESVLSIGKIKYFPGKTVNSSEYGFVFIKLCFSNV